MKITLTKEEIVEILTDHMTQWLAPINIEVTDDGSNVFEIIDVDGKEYDYESLTFILDAEHQ